MLLILFILFVFFACYLFWGILPALNKEITRVFGNFSKEINKINTQIDSVQSQLEITCFDICVFLDWHTGPEEELYLNTNRGISLSALYIAGQFVFLHDNRLLPQIGVDSRVNDKYKLSVLATQKTIEIQLLEKTTAQEEDSLFGVDFDLVLHDSFPIKSFIESYDAEKLHISMGSFLFDKENHCSSDSYEFKNNNFSVWISKSHPNRSLNTHYQESMKSRWKNHKNNLTEEE